MNLTEIVIGLVVVSGVAWFWRGRGVRERALTYAQARCRSEGLQLLDGYVAFAGWQLFTDARGRRYLVRRYTFEFSVSGRERLQALMLMYGQRLLKLELPPYPCRAENAPSEAIAAEVQTQPAPPAGTTREP